MTENAYSTDRLAFEGREREAAKAALTSFAQMERDPVVRMTDAGLARWHDLSTHQQYIGPSPLVDPRFAQLRAAGALNMGRFQQRPLGERPAAVETIVDPETGDVYTATQVQAWGDIRHPDTGGPLVPEQTTPEGRALRRRTLGLPPE